MTLTKPKLLGKLLIETALGDFLGDKRIRLLEAIERHGSISQAAKVVPISYKAAWDAIDAMNNIAPEPIVLRAAGGQHGGGTQLTAFGRRLIAIYRALELEQQAALEKLTIHLNNITDLDIAGFRQMLRRMSMKTSARNQFAGSVTAIREGIVDSEVTIRLNPELELTAIVTRDSAENLNLAVGSDIMAFVKASSILLVIEDKARISARNRFTGKIVNIHQGSVNAEVTLELGRHALTAVITLDSVKSMGLTAGQSVTAVFKASSVFLATTN